MSDQEKLKLEEAKSNLNDILATLEHIRRSL